MRRETIRVGTRGSLLARTQTQWVLDRLCERHPGLHCQTVTILTAGDERTHQVPARAAGKGFFTREIEEALRAGTVDLAVHSLKDLPTESPPDLAVTAIPEREDPGDALVGCTLADLLRAPEQYCLGTSSLRRQTQLRRAFPGCRVVDLRGNLDTRLARVRGGQVDGAVLAIAGLCRLGRAGEISQRLPSEVMLPAPGQGALALQVRADDTDLRDLLAAVHCPVSGQCVAAERAFMHSLGGGCQLPVAALAVMTDGRLHVRGRVLALTGRECVEGGCDGVPEAPEALGQALAADLLARGAGEILRGVQREMGKETQHG
jgi:hydroxymethylbilane synthase